VGRIGDVRRHGHRGRGRSACGRPVDRSGDPDADHLRAFRGDLTDERLRRVELRAVAFSGRVVILVLAVAYVVQLVRGHVGAPYTWLLAIGGASYLGAFIYGLRR
jgi:hypothetical protein